MKQQSLSLKRFSSGSIDNQNTEPTTPLSQLIAKTFLKNTQNKLLFASQTISMIKPIAISYLEEFPQRHQPFNCQLLLIDFSQLEIDYLQQTLRKIALNDARRNYFEPDTVGALDIVRMNSQPIDKRKAQYMKPSLLSLSSQVFLTDLLRGWSQGHGLRIRIILKMSDKVTNYYHYHAWLTTILKIKQVSQNDRNSNVSIIYLCTTPHYYCEQNELVAIYRTFFCKQVIIWPFGRAEVHKALTSYRQKNSIKEYEHNLSFSDGERKLYETLMQLYNFLKKKQASKNTKKTVGQSMLYSTPYEEGYQVTKGESTQFQHVKLLLVYLESSSKLAMLNLITKFIEMKDCEIWNSNNSEAIAIIENLLNQLQQSILSYEKKEAPSNVLLIHLFSKLQGLEIEINFEKQYQFACTYPLLLSLQLKTETNQKFTEVIKIIETIQPIKQQVEEKIDEGEDQASKRLFEQLRKNQDESLNHNVLVMCGLKGVERFVRESLEAYIADKTYLHYIRNLHRYLSATRYFRMRKIKKIYDRRKVKKGDNPAQGSKKINDKHTWAEDNKEILKEILFQQLDKLNIILMNFQVSLGAVNSGTDIDMNSQDTFQRNRDEIKIIESFNEQIMTSDFKIIDISRIKVTSLLASIQSYTFHTNHLKKKVLVDHESRSIEPNYFYQLLSNIDPSTIIFYNPSPLLLRSLYLFQLQNSTQKLRSLHILSYENSYQSKKASFEITKEDKAFWNISQNRSKLPQFIQSPFLRVKSINFRDSIQLAKHRLNSKSLFRDENEGDRSIGEILGGQEIRRKILVDTRQFKSSLPSYLYHHGFQVIPVFLKTSDYVLSDDSAIEKKSVHTRDLHNSLKSFRLDEQLKRMCSRFKHPYLLIECQEQTDFVKSNFGYLDGTSGNKGRYQLRKKLIQLLNKFPTVRLIWSSSVEQSCLFIRQLKEDKMDPDLAKFIRQQNEEMPQEKSMNLSRISQASQQKQQQDK